MNQNPDIKNYGAYLRTVLNNALYKSQLKKGSIDPTDKLKEIDLDPNVVKSEHAVPFYNWLEE